MQIVMPLEEAGFDEPQDKAPTIVLRDLRETDFSSFATKADIQLLKTEIERVEAKLVTEIERVEPKLMAEIERVEAKLMAEIGRVASRLEVKIAEAKADVIRWMFGIAFAQAALILAVLRLFPNAHP